MGRPRKPRSAALTEQKAIYWERQLSPELQAAVRDVIVHRLVSGRRKRGLLDGRGSGTLPYGFVGRADGALEIDEEAAPIIRLALRLRQQYTYQEVAARLNAAGYRTARGKQWTGSHVYKIERHRALYETGIREWDGVVADVRWPIIAEAA